MSDDRKPRRSKKSKPQAEKLSFDRDDPRQMVLALDPGPGHAPVQLPVPLSLTPKILKKGKLHEKSEWSDARRHDR